MIRHTSSVVGGIAGAPKSSRSITPPVNGTGGPSPDAAALAELPIRSVKLKKKPQTKQRHLLSQTNKPLSTIVGSHRAVTRVERTTWHKTCPESIGPKMMYFCIRWAYSTVLGHTKENRKLSQPTVVTSFRQLRYRSYSLLDRDHRCGCRRCPLRVSVSMLFGYRNAV